MDPQSGACLDNALACAKLAFPKERTVKHALVETLRAMPTGLSRLGVWPARVEACFASLRR